MGNLNYITGIVKILESPKNQRIKNKNNIITQFRAQIPQIRGTRMVSLTFWGNLARDILTYYKVNDYLLIEGYISLKDQKKQSSAKRKSKKVEITVLKVYPFILNSNHFSTKF